MAFSDSVGSVCRHCGTRDFLPITCTVCAAVFCKDHAAFAVHGCEDPSLAATLALGTAPEIPRFGCSEAGCGVLSTVVATCEWCSKVHCLRHRSPMDHACVGRPVPEACVLLGAPRRDAAVVALLTGAPAVCFADIRGQWWTPA